MPGIQPWWQMSIIYQVCPLSFQDSDGDGIGDVEGIRQRLDYVHSLNVGCIWVSPINPLPAAGLGNDDAERKVLTPPIGTLEDLNRLLEATHARGMKLIPDMISSHSSRSPAWSPEGSGSHPSKDASHGMQLDECHLPFNFQILNAEWQAPAIREFVEECEAALPPGAWPNWTLGNHDQKRVATRVGLEQARVANLLLLTLRGTPTCCYGDELGMQNTAIPPESMRNLPAALQLGIASSSGRDTQCTPMQWDDSPNGGFAPAGVQSWLPLAPSYRTQNVAAQSVAPTSMLSFYRAVTALRQSSPALMTGDYQAVDAGKDDVFAYLRTARVDSSEQRCLIVLNFGTATYRLDFSSLGKKANLLLSTNMLSTGDVPLRRLYLSPNEGMILAI